MPPTAEALLIGGDGLRAVGTIARLEASLNLPVLTANQVLAWTALGRLGLAGEVTKYGRVFQASSGNGADPNPRNDGGAT